MCGRFEIKGLIFNPLSIQYSSLSTIIYPDLKNGKKGFEELGESPIEDEEADRGDLIINSNTRPRGRLEYRNRLKKVELKKVGI